MACPGMTFDAVFGTEMTVTCKLEGWKFAVPSSSLLVAKRSMMRASFGTGLSAICG